MLIIFVSDKILIESSFVYLPNIIFFTQFILAMFLTFCLSFCDCPTIKNFVFDFIVNTHN